MSEMTRNQALKTVQLLAWGHTDGNTHAEATLKGKGVDLAQEFKDYLKSALEFFGIPYTVNDKSMVPGKIAEGSNIPYEIVHIEGAENIKKLYDVLHERPVEQTAFVDHTDGEDQKGLGALLDLLHSIGQSH